MQLLKNQKSGTSFKKDKIRIYQCKSCGACACIPHAADFFLCKECGERFVKWERYDVIKLHTMRRRSYGAHGHANTVSE